MYSPLKKANVTLLFLHLVFVTSCEQLINFGGPC